ncbi:NAD(P)H-dependent oxidoreductase [Streptomyces sp. HNM0575]|uniref:NADPH-dependent FMN reductase n=1 Tax=Streptomyces sp. HNM0575 TaxID=2716338 RepID=UPI00145F0573|nr:NAD(P)H-dependent oxidoreductase [Streptomyces sp. HNM0575]NLU74111.1 NAD(P)H-dependent oxidoreductase [Streptomyces sp. HNM0575]
MPATASTDATAVPADTATAHVAPRTGAQPAGPEPAGPEPADPETLRLAVIVGSVRKGRFGPVVSDWFAEEARKHGGYEVDVIDLAEAEHELPVAFAEFGAPLPPPVKAVHSGLSRRLAAADAFVIVTPEYNHSFPAPLKNTIDWFRDEWQAKPAGFVSYGGMAGGQRAVEHLRQVFAELHAVTVRETLSFHMAWERFDADGRLREEEAGSAAAGRMLRQLAWWGSALREARAKSPYGAAA